MRSAATATHLLPDAPVLAARFGLIMGGLMALIAKSFLRRPKLMGLTVVLWNWLSRKRQRFARMLGQPVRAAAAARGAPGNRPAAPARVPGGVLPRGRGWLVKELGWEAVAYTSQLTALLDEPAMQAALAAMPGLARVLRPLCRMLGVERRALPETPVTARSTPAAVITLAPSGTKALPACAAVSRERSSQKC